ncbi:MFS transporter [Sphaerisporangium aureirubrum]|uniref:MFS transporter n=1 Tax=Sphaerisporangium aureirubrum TaxID=1544736 RepID=A0ABW1NQG6_9ACTN
MIDIIPLRRQRDYRLLWTARAVSETGTEVSRLAVPLTAAVLLGAGPFQMGLLAAVATLPYLLIGLPAGAWADRLPRRRPLLVGCEIVAALAMLTVPLAWMGEVLSIAWLITVAFVVGTCTVVFRAAWFPHLPSVVADHQRTAAIAGFQTVYSTASVFGPGLAGVLVQTLTAPVALLADAASFLLSALCLRSIRSPEKPTGPARVPGSASATGDGTDTGTEAEAEGGAGNSDGNQTGTDGTVPPRGGLLSEIRDGLRIVLTHPILRTLITAGVLINFASAAQLALYVLFAVRTLGLPAGIIGLLTASFGVGGILGAALTPRLTSRFSENRMLLIAGTVLPAEMVILAAAHGSPAVVVPIVMTGYLLSGVSAVIFSVCYGSIQLREAPRDAVGRVNSVMSVSTLGVMTLGGLVGGVLGDLVGLRPALWICAALICLSPLFTWLSPLRHPARTVGP